MKRSGILHPELAFQIASCGHGDLVCIADAGLPIPPETPRIDLAYALGQPGFFNVLEAILPELAIEGAVWAEEAARRMRAWNFNTCGAGNGREMRGRDLAFTE